MALYNFNIGNAGGSNVWMTTAFDLSPNNLHGTISNLAMTGTASNYVGNLLVALPVTYTRFVGVRENGRVHLQWQTASEQNSARFGVERSLDGRNFTPIGSVPATGQGSSYAFFDNSPAVSTSYYRLREVDVDGREQLSAIRVVAALTETSKLSVVRNGGRVELVLKGGADEPYTISDLSGRVLCRGHLEQGRGALNLRSGVYLASVPGIQSVRFLVP